MNRFLVFLALLWTSVALAADTPVACTGANCKVKIEARNGSNVKVTAAQFADSSLATVDGTASLPAVSFITDPDTGMYRSAADQLAFAAAGGQRLRLNSTGAVVTGNLTVAGTSINGVNKISIPSDAPSSRTPAYGYQGIVLARSANSAPLSTGIPVYAGTYGLTNMIVCSANSGSGNLTQSAVYIVRSFQDNANTWSPAVGVTFVGGGSAGANTGGDAWTFGCSEACSNDTSTNTITMSRLGNWTCQIFGNG